MRPVLPQCKPVIQAHGEHLSNNIWTASRTLTGAINDRKEVWLGLDHDLRRRAPGVQALF